MSNSQGVARPVTQSDFFLITGLFYIGWFGIAFIGRSEAAAASLLFPVALIGYLISRILLTLPRLRLAIAVFAIGIVFDLALIQLGFVSTQGLMVYSIPLWLISIWLLFSFAFVILASRLRLPAWLVGLLGFFVGPLTYKSGEVFQLISFATPMTFLIYAIFWAALLPTVLFFAKKVS